MQAYANQVKQIFATKYASRSALRSPPHITLQPPFEWLLAQLPTLTQCLQKFAQQQAPIPLKVSGFGAFAPRVIYLQVEPTAALLALQTDLMTWLETTLGIVNLTARNRPFTPHLTVGSHDLTQQNFQAAWAEFQPQSVEFTFTVPSLTLLQHSGQQWQVNQEFLLGTDHAA